MKNCFIDAYGNEVVNTTVQAMEKQLYCKLWKEGRLVYSVNMRDQLLNMSHLSRKGTLVWSLPTKVGESIVVLLTRDFYSNEVRNTKVQTMKKRQLRCKMWKESKLVYSLKMRPTSSHEPSF